jgi:hypothetical protein
VRPGTSWIKIIMGERIARARGAESSTRNSRSSLPQMRDHPDDQRKRHCQGRPRALTGGHRFVRPFATSLAEVQDFRSLRPTARARARTRLFGLTLQVTQCTPDWTVPIASARASAACQFQQTSPVPPPNFVRPNWKPSLAPPEPLAGLAPRRRRGSQASHSRPRRRVRPGCRWAVTSVSRVESDA